jgi:prevent-host-death family protein
MNRITQTLLLAERSEWHCDPVCQGSLRQRLANVLRLTHMESVPVRELQQHASAVLRRVKAGERVLVTDRGTVVAVLVPPTDIGGAAGLVAAGRVRLAIRPVVSRVPTRTSDLTTAEVLNDLRSDLR